MKQKQKLNELSGESIHRIYESYFVIDILATSFKLDYGYLFRYICYISSIHNIENKVGT